MRQLTLTKRQIQMVTQQLEAKEQGYDRGQLRQLDKLIDELEAVTDGFVADMRAIGEDLQQELRRLRHDKEAREAAIADADSASWELIDQHGDDSCTILLENDLWGFLQSAWNDEKTKFRGDRTFRRLMLAVDTALGGAQEVKATAVSPADEADSNGHEPLRPRNLAAVGVPRRKGRIT